MSRLIDADKVYTIIVEEMWDADDFPHDEQQAVLRACYSIKERIEKRAPIVDAIPIDKPFLKMRYGDYVVYNKKWLVDHLQTEWNILQGKEYQPSISVEWIKNYLIPFQVHHDSLSEDSKENDGAGWVIDVLETMMREWEKENEHKESD